MPFLPQQMPFLQTSKSATSPVMGAIRCLSIWASLKPTEEVVPTLSAKDRVTNDPWQQMRYPVFIHFFSWLKLRFFLIVLSTSCLWLYWRVDWIKFDDPQKSFLGKWCLRETQSDSGEVVGWLWSLCSRLRKELKKPEAWHTWAPGWRIWALLQMLSVEVVGWVCSWLRILSMIPCRTNRKYTSWSLLCYLVIALCVLSYCVVWEF